MTVPVSRSSTKVPCGWNDRGRWRSVPPSHLSPSGTWVPMVPPARAICTRASVSGRDGVSNTGWAKSIELVRSPLMPRRHGVMVVLSAGVPMALVHVSRNWMIEVWSKVSPLTQPPRVQGETRMAGTRGP